MTIEPLSRIPSVGVGETESPFLQTYTFESAPGEPRMSSSTPSSESPFATEYFGDTATSPNALGLHEALSHLYESEFEEAISELAQEAAAVYAERLSAFDAVPRLGESDRMAVQEVESWLAPLQDASERLLREFAERVGSRDVYGMSENELEGFLSEIDPVVRASVGETPEPAFENFLGGLLDKAKSFVKGAVNIAKKGLAVVGKILPINFLLNKLTGLIRPLIDKLINSATKLLPESVRPLALTLAKRLLGEAEAEALEPEAGTTTDVTSLAREFDIQAAQLMLAPSEPEAEFLLSEVTAETANPPEAAVDLDAARGRFVDRLSKLQRGEDPTPAMEEFLPALMAARPLISMALNILGKEKITNFFAGKISSFIAPYIGADGAKTLAQALASAGLHLLTGEAPADEATTAATTIAATTEDTVRRLAELPQEAYEDPMRLEGEVTRAFYEAAAANFPPQLLRPDLPQRESSLDGTWVPRPHKRYRYKKYTRIFDVTVTPQMAQALKTFGGGTLAAVLQDQMGLTLPVKARVHLYEALPGAWLSTMAAMEHKTPGLGGRRSRGWHHMHPLTAENAGLLLQQPGMGVTVAPEYLVDRHKITAGQRFFYLEIPGARVKMVAGGRRTHAAHHSQVNVTVDLRPASRELRLSIYLSEREAQTLVPKLRARDISGAFSILQTIARAGINTALTGGIRKHVRLVSEEVPLEHFNTAGVVANLGRELLQPIINSMAESASSAVSTYLKTKSDELVAAIEQPEDGVTIVVVLPGSPITGLLQSVVKGQLPDAAQLAALAKGTAAAAQVSVVAGFKR